MYPIKENQIVEVEISKITYKGKAVARLDNLVIFLNQGVPQDIVKAKITKLKKNYAEGEIVSILKPSIARISPQCIYFDQCGGCQLQNISYEYQLEYKEIMLRDSLQHIGKIDHPINKIIPSQKNFEYRNQIQLKICSENEINLGFYKEMTHEIINIDTCLLQTKIGNSILKTINQFLKKKKHTNITKISDIVIRVSNDEKKVAIIFDGEIPFENEISNCLISNFPEIKYIIKNVKEPTILFGSNDFAYDVKELSFQISLRNFWQVNFAQIENLIDIILNYSELKGHETVLDVYCGAGLFSLFLAKNSRFVYGIELNPSAIIDAKKNAKLNQILNVKFIKGDVKEIFKTNFLPKIDVIILDPPRMGCEPEAIKKILEIRPQKIIYVSCDPATLSRDLQLLKEQYKIIEIQPIDMFPQTYHIETVVKLDLKIS